jgi:hypothetical protein
MQVTTACEINSANHKINPQEWNAKGHVCRTAHLRDDGVQVGRWGPGKGKRKPFLNCDFGGGVWLHEGAGSGRAL